MQDAFDDNRVSAHRMEDQVGAVNRDANAHAIFFAQAIDFRILRDVGALVSQFANEGQCAKRTIGSDEQRNIFDIAFGQRR